MPSYDLNGKVALITGAARGIGYETARLMHARGASVAVVDLDAGQAGEAAERIGRRAIGLGADVTDRTAVMGAVAATVERLGGLDVAVANAGIAPPTITTTRSMPAEEWDRVLDVNLLGACHTARAALPQISERRGQVVFIGSIYSIHPKRQRRRWLAPSSGGRRASSRRASGASSPPFGACSTRSPTVTWSATRRSPPRSVRPRRVATAARAGRRRARRARAGGAASGAATVMPRSSSTD